MTSDKAIPLPLPTAGVLATLLVVLGVIDLKDAANSVGFVPEDLIAEAEAWAAAGGSQP